MTDERVIHILERDGYMYAAARFKYQKERERELKTLYEQMNDALMLIGDALSDIFPLLDDEDEE